MSEFKTIGEFQEYTRMSPYSLALYRSYGLFETQRDRAGETILDCRWFTVWKEHFAYMKAGFDKLEALFHATEDSFGADYFEKWRTQRMLYGI